MDTMKGKVAIVTGGASGIGKITAKMFASRGVRVVVVTDSNVKGAEETAQSITKAGGEASFVKCDVSKEKDVEAMVAKTIELYGSLDFAFNNAGVGPDGKRIQVYPITKCPEEIWDKTLDINLKGVWLCMKYEIREMIKKKKGSIVNTSSVAALRPIPGFGVYAASKNGLIALTRTAALECAPFGIRVNAICPGLTLGTQLSDNLLGANPDKKEMMTKAVPLGRMAKPEEMAEAVMWLCSDASSFTTGHALPVDGGLSAG